MKELWTIGHSTHPIVVFSQLLQKHHIDLLIDVRTAAGSAYCPQFNKKSLARHLNLAGIEYQWTPTLGGLRKAQDVDPTLNAAWRNKSFKNYADYTLSESYRESIAILKMQAQEHSVCIMCAESVPWRCHRIIISTTLAVAGFAVHHIMPPKVTDHVLGEWGPEPHIEGKRVTYPLRAGETAWEAF